MTVRHGSKAVFQVTDVHGTIHDISEYIGRTGLDRTLDTAEVSNLHAWAKRYITGLTDATFPIEGPYDPDLDKWIYESIGGSALMTFSYAPAGSATGYPVMSGSGMWSNYEVSTPLDNAAGITAEFQCSGSITVTTL
jgi:hypothetical protein